MHEGKSQIEIRRKSVIEVETYQCLTLHTEALVLEGDVDTGTRVDITLVENRYDSHVVIDRIVDVFGKCYTAGRNPNRASGYVECVEMYLGTV